MPRPKGCTCGTPVPCRVHPASDPPGGQAQGDSPGVVAGEPSLRLIDPEPGTDNRRPAGVDSSASGKRKRPDPAPKPRSSRSSRAKKPSSPDAPDDAALQQMLSELLTMPAIPAAMLLDCAYCRDHFIAEGPKAARELVALSLVNPALRGALESIHTAWSRVTIAGVLVGYLAKPMMHHLAPEPVLTAAGPVLGVPPRPPKPSHQHGPTEETEGAEGAYGTPAPDQYPGAQAA